MSHLQFLVQLVRTFPDQATIRSMLKCASVNSSHIKHDGNEGEECRTSESVPTHESGENSSTGNTQDNPNGAVINESSEHDSQLTTTEPTSSTITQSGEQEQTSEMDEFRRQAEDIPNDVQLHLRCIYSLLLPWLLDVEQKSDCEMQVRHVQMEAIVDMIIALVATLPAENQSLVTDAVCLKAQSPEVVHLLITKVSFCPH